MTAIQANQANQVDMIISKKILDPAVSSKRNQWKQIHHSLKQENYT
jgi:hypothetical protein